MAGTRKILSRIRSAKNISQITKAMEMVSASKMKKAQEAALNGQPYSIHLRQIISSLLALNKSVNHPLINEVVKFELKTNLCICVTTNKGLCGGLNTNHFRMINRWLKENPDTDFITIGKKGRMFLAAIGVNIIADFSDLPENIYFEQTLTISRYIQELFRGKQYQKIYLSFNHFISTLAQKPKLVQILPIDPHSLKDEDLGLLKELDEEQEQKFQTKEYIIEPNAKTIIHWLLPYFVELQLYHFLLENKASEHSARMVAMKNASQNAQDVMKQLRLVYNKMRQQQITMELADIITATSSIQ
ncbi:ATP synthase F1 subunit gamma [Candidatus Beckwithbacteria bacterium]|nr:ATP synthase F1 subunit gamma [Candidatus Beckwithbacteria bacterium]